MSESAETWTPWRVTWVTRRWRHQMSCMSQSPLILGLRKKNLSSSMALDENTGRGQGLPTTTTIIIWLQYYTTTNIQIYFFRNSRGAKENGRAQYQNSAPTINLVFLINPPWSTDIPKNPNSKAIYHGSGLPRPMRKLDPPTLCQRLLPPDSGGSDFWQIRWIGRKNPRTSDWWLDASASESRARFCHPGALVVCGDRCIVSRSEVL